jgi:hypothetical protein
MSVSSSPSISNYKEVEALVDTKITAAIERDIRTTVDSGVDRTGSPGVRVKAKEGGFEIYAKGHDDVLRATSKQMGGGKSPIEAGSVEGLFAQSSGVPESEPGPGGSTKLVFKSISVENLFNEQKEVAKNFAIGQAVTQSVRMNLAPAYNEAMDEVDRKNPVMK